MELVNQLEKEQFGLSDVIITRTYTPVNNEAKVIYARTRTAIWRTNPVGKYTDNIINAGHQSKCVTKSLKLTLAITALNIYS